MPTNDERREVVARLRDARVKLESVPVPKSIGEQSFTYLLELAKAIGKHDGALFDRFADLIEPEPERTCTFTDNWNDPDLPLPTCSACGWEAEETDCVCVIGGPMFQYDGKFCKECGAKVVDE